MTDKISVFLGGTCGKSTWREPFTEALVEAGIQRETILNPVVPDWTPACQKEEDEAKAKAQFNLFLICSTGQPDNPVSLYSLVEATIHLYDYPATTVVVFQPSDYPGHTGKSVAKSQADLRKRFPDGHIYSTQEEAIAFLVRALGAR